MHLIGWIYFLKIVKFTCVICQFYEIFLNIIQINKFKKMKGKRIDEQSYLMRFIQQMVKLQKDMSTNHIRIILIVVKTISIMLLFTFNFYNKFYNKVELASTIINLLQSLLFAKFIVILQIIASILQMILINFNIFKKIKNHFFLCKILYIISNLLTLYYIIAINKLWHSQEYKFFIFSLFFLPIVLIKIYFSAITYVFGALTPFMIAFYLELDPLFTGIIVFIHSIYTFNKQYQKLFIWKTWIMIILSFFMILNSYENPKGGISLFSFWFAFVVITIMMVIQPSYYGKDNYVYLLSLAEKMKKQDMISYQTKIYLHLSLAIEKMIYDLKERRQICIFFKPQNKKYVTKIDILQFLLRYINAINKDPWKVLEIKIAMKNDIYEIYQLLNTLECKTINDKIKYKQLKLKIEQNFIEPQNLIDLQSITELQKNLIKFYSNIDKCLLKYYIFYQYLSQLHISQNKIQFLHEEAMFYQKQIINSLNNIQRYRSSPKQRKIVKQIYNLINHYDSQLIQQRFKQNYQKNDQIREKQYIYKNFILTKNNKIKELSINLLPKINQKALLLLQSQFSELVNRNILNIISEKIKQYQRKTFYLPLNVNKQRIIILKGTLHIIPTQNNGTMQLYLFDQEEFNTPAFLYDYKNDNIFEFSSQAYKENIFLHQLHEISQHNFSNKIFQIDLSNPSVFNALRSGNQLKTRFKQIKSNINTSKLHINMKYLQQFTNNDEKFIIVTLYHQMKLISVKDLARQSQFISQKKQTTNKTFCPIQNPYKQQLISKFTEIRYNKISVKTVKYTIILILIVTLLIIYTILSMKQRSTVNQQYDKILVLSHQLTNKYGDVMLIFYYSYIKYNLYKYPQQILKYKSDLDVTNLNNIFHNQLESLIMKVQTQELNNRYISFKPYVQYKIQFQNYNITLDTHQPFDLSTLLVKTQQFLLSNDIKYHIDNYEAYAKLQQSFSVSKYFDMNIRQDQQYNMQFLFIHLSIMSILIIAFIILQIHFNNQISNFYEISSRITSNQIQILLKDIQDKRRQIKVLNYLSLDNNDNLYYIQENYKEVEKEGKRFARLGLFGNIKKGWILFLILGLFAIILILHRSHYTKQLQNFKKMHNYLLQIEQSHNEIIQYITQAVYFSIKKDLDKNYTIPKPLSSFKAYSYFKDDQLPQYFSAFRNNVKNILYSDLCQYNFLNNLQIYQNISCNTIQSNALGYGFSVAFQKYQYEVLNNLVQVPFVQLFNTKNKQKYPIFIELSYMRRIITYMTIKIRQLFKVQAKEYFAAIQKSKQQLFIVYFFCINVIAVLSLLWIVHRKKQCQNAIKFIKSIPRTTLFSIKNTKHLIKIKLLQNLHQL